MAQKPPEKGKKQDIDELKFMWKDHENTWTILVNPKKNIEFSARGSDIKSYQLNCLGVGTTEGMNKSYKKVYYMQ